HEGPLSTPTGRFFYWVRERLEDIATVPDGSLANSGGVPCVALLTQTVTDDDIGGATTLDAITLHEYAGDAYRRQVLIDPDMSDPAAEEGAMVGASAYFGVLGPDATGAVAALLYIGSTASSDDDTNSPSCVFSLPDGGINGDAARAVALLWPNGV